MNSITFNNKIEVDVIFIGEDPVLHNSNRGTRYSVAKFMDNQTAIAHTQKKRLNAMRAARQEMETITAQIYEFSDKVRVWREASPKC